MSLKYMVAAFECKLGSHVRKLVLLKLADNANDEGMCFPSYNTIARICELSRRSVISHVKALQDLGLVKVVHRDGEKGNSSNEFWLDYGAMRSLGVVNLVHQGGESYALGVVNDVHPESTSIESTNEPLGHLFEKFWFAYPKKHKKKQAKVLFDKLVFKRKDADEFTDMLVNDIKNRIAAEQFGFDRLDPTTYLKYERWEDDIVNERKEEQLDAFGAGGF